MCKEIAITGIVILEGVALWLGYDGALLAAVIGVIAGIAGYEVRIIQEKKK